MARVRGINIEINANTRELQRNLDNATTQSRRLTTELRQVDRALRLDPTSTDLLAQRQRLLGENIASTRERLTALRQAQ